jgi:hypothetical protein
VTGSSLTIEQMLGLLAATPARLAALTADLEPARLREAPAPDEWSANDVLAHLRACADVWGGCAAAILAEDRPALRAVNPTTWVKRTDYRDLEFRPSLHAFSAQRNELLAVLDPLPPEGWARSATVTGTGKPLQRTVLSYARWPARHERPHVTQVARIVAALPR